MDLPEGFLEDLRNHFQDGYELGKQDERARISSWIELDLLLPESIKERVLDFVRGGKDSGN